jgi:hypothetical protein
MNYSQKRVSLGLAGFLAICITAAGCATPWFGNSKAAPATPADQSAATSSADTKQAAVAYINGLCKLSSEQRETQVRDLNQALLPHHAAISCGRGGGAQ